MSYTVQSSDTSITLQDATVSATGENLYLRAFNRVSCFTSSEVHFQHLLSIISTLRQILHVFLRQHPVCP